MFIKQIFVQTWQIIIILTYIHTYVLFAANLDDFRSIAKKFIPNKLADQLTAMAAQNSMKSRQQSPEQAHSLKEMKEYSHEEYSNREVTIPAAVREITTQKKRFNIKNQAKDLDFDELVDRVREQLEEKYKTQLKSEPKHENPKKEYKNDYSDESSAHEHNNDKYPTSKTFKTPKEKIPPKSTTEDSQYYDDAGPKNEPRVPKNDGTLFQEADLTKKHDSYEDYVIPNKDNMFESDIETKTIKPQRVLSEKESRYNPQRLAKKPETEDDQDYSVHKSEEVKAKTETLFDESEQRGYTHKKLKGTMIPTREFYKMSSPSYYDKVAVAEKYDFNEPLPEKDREPENLKYFVNPPASINKKVRLT